MKIEKRTYKDFVIDHVYGGIMEGRLEPGQKVLEVSLSAELGISRAPVREALREMIGDGLLDYRPQIGTFVALLSASDIRDAYATRGVLEGFAAACAAPFLLAEDLKRLEELCQQMEQDAGDGKQRPLIDTGEAFHHLILSRCPNPLLTDFSARLSRKVHIQFSRHWGQLYDASQIRSRHLQIVAALETGDFRQIEETLRSHYFSTGERIAALIENRSKEEAS